VGLRIVIAALSLALAGPSPVAYLQSRQAATGGFAEPGGTATPGLTAWAALGLRAAGVDPGPQARAYLVAHEDEFESATDVELGILGERAAGADATRLLGRLRSLEHPNGTIGPQLNSTIWGIIALRGAGEPVPPAAVRYVVARQSEAGGWSWAKPVGPDSNDTAAAIEALRAVGVRGRPIRRGIAYLRRFQGRDGGFELQRGAGSDTQSTAWAVQAFVAAGVPPPRSAFRYLARMRRPDGSYRQSARYGGTPVWVTSQVLPALSGRPFPLPG
jgi:energy-coupling factor transport system substrate-specific component